MRPMIATAEVLADHLGDPEQCPEIGAMPAHRGGGGSGIGFGRSPRAPARLNAGYQRFTELTEAENWRATADRVCPALTCAIAAVPAAPVAWVCWPVSCLIRCHPPAMRTIAS